MFDVSIIFTDFKDFTLLILTLLFFFYLEKYANTKSNATSIEPPN